MRRGGRGPNRGSFGSRSYSSRESQPSSADGKIPATEDFYSAEIPRIDRKLNQFTWVKFILKLKNNARLIFGSAADSIKREEVPIFQFPTPPTDKKGSDYVIWKNLISKVQDVAQKHADDTSKGLDMLMSEKFMDPTIRIQLENHYLFTKVLKNQEPTREECEQWSISYTKKFYYDEYVGAMNPEESDIGVDFTHEDAKSSVSTSTTSATSVPVIGARNIVLMIKLLRVIIL
jgi:hypothetical protein